MASNDTEIPTYENCHDVSDRCKVEFTIYGDYLSTAASAIFAIAFALFLVIQLVQGCRGRMWSYTFWLAIGTFFELLGYAARYLLSKNPWRINAFLAQYVTLLLAPTLVAAAISVTFKHLIIWYGTQWSLFRPKFLPWIFVGTDFISIFIQVIGGGATAASTTGNGSEGVRKLGEALVIGGVIFQVVNMLCCATLMLIYVKRRKSSIKSGFGQIGPDNYISPHPGQSIATCRAGATPKEAKKAAWFIYILGIAYVAIIIRCIYRVFETLPATSSKVMANETYFYIFDGAMLFLAIGGPTILHPVSFFPFLGFKGKIENQMPMSARHG